MLGTYLDFENIDSFKIGNYNFKMNKLEISLNNLYLSAIELS